MRMCGTDPFTASGKRDVATKPIQPSLQPLTFSLSGGTIRSTVTLLSQIQAEVVDPGSDLASILRKCRILAQRLGHEGFKEWVIHELDGYPDVMSLPDYRVCRRCAVLGHFLGAFGREIKNAQIPASAIPEDFRDDLTQIPFTQGVTAIKQQIDASQDGFLRVAWPAEAYKIIGQGDIFRDMHLVQAVQMISAAELAGILDSVRNKILNFVLELESRNPEAGEPVSNKNAIPKEQVQQVFNTTIQGNVTNLAQGSSDFTQVVQQIERGDVGALVRALAALGLGHDDVDELTTAVSAEPTATKTGFGHKVTAWIGKVITKAAQGAYKVSTAVAGDVITAALKRYYGI
jgi:AbiTii